MVLAATRADTGSGEPQTPPDAAEPEPRTLQATRTASSASADSAEAGDRPPHDHWQPDRPQCTLCQAHFHALRRRHHCRACGTVACDACAPDKAIVLPAEFGCGSLPQRVCYGCVIDLPSAPPSVAGRTCEEHGDSSCQLCQTPFHGLRRRHHCRACGRAMCGSCGANYRPLPALGHTTPVKFSSLTMSGRFGFCLKRFSTINQIYQKLLI